MFKGMHNKQFRFIHCWYMLWHEVKWTTWLSNSEVHRDNVNGKEMGLQSRDDEDRFGTPTDAFVRQFAL